MRAAVFAQFVRRELPKAEVVAKEETTLEPQDLEAFAEPEAAKAVIVLPPQRRRRRRSELHAAIRRHRDMDAEKRGVEIGDRIDVDAKPLRRRISVQVPALEWHDPMSLCKPVLAGDRVRMEARRIDHVSGSDRSSRRPCARWSPAQLCRPRPERRP